METILDSYWKLCFRIGVIKKQHVIDFFLGVPKTAEVLGITRAAVHGWPDPLPPRIADRVIGAAYRKGYVVPRAWTRGVESAHVAGSDRGAETQQARAA